MDFRQFRYFVAVAEELHFARAGERLGIAQPALSQQIKALEDRLGVRLFIRAKRRIELTEAGRVFLTEARAVLERAERAVDLARRAGRGELGIVGIGYVGAAMVQPTLPRILSDFRRSHPGVELSFRFLPVLDQLAAVRDRDLDVAVVRMPVGPLPEALEAHPIVREPLIAALPEEHPLARGDAVRFADLAEESFIAFADPEGVGLGQLLTDLGREAGFRPRVVQRVFEQAAMLGLVAAGIGVGLMADAVRCLHVPGVRFLTLSDVATLSELVIVHRRGETAPAVRALLSAARSAYRDRPDDAG